MAGQQSSCANCGMRATEPFCGHCGQPTDTSIPTLWAVVSDFLDGLYNLDSRLWRSLAPLAFRPGLLTLEYKAGRRARYMPPFRLYLILSVMFFVGNSLLGDSASVMAGAASEFIASDSPRDAREVCDPLLSGFAPSGAIYRELSTACERSVADNGRTLMQSFASRVPLMLFLLVPLMAAMFKPLYFFSGRKYVEHLMFLFHVHAFFFLGAGVSLVLSAIPKLPYVGLVVTTLDLLVSLYMPVYAFIALRNFYGQSTSLRIVKFLVLCCGYLLMLSLTFLLFFAYSALQI